jgi:HEPN domain-containing protein
MPPDEPRLEDAQAWLDRAVLDLRAADLELGTPEAGLWGDVAFHAQQAAEKSLKAFLALNDVPFRKTHSIEELGRACTEIDPGLGPLVDAAAPLTEFAWKFRYPGDGSDPTREEAGLALSVARKLVVLVRARLAEWRPG